MKINSEQEMLNFGKTFANTLNWQTSSSILIELIGDVGTGKTTFVRGLAEGLGVSSTVTSPSFTISKTYALPNGKTLTHYDFYRLDDPGIMQEDLNDSLKNPNNITIIEWGNSVQDFLPKDRVRISIKYNNDNSREINVL